MIFIIATIALLISFSVQRGQKTISLIALAVDAYLMGVPAALHNPDNAVYRLSYINHLTNFEKGYTFLATQFSNYGVSFETFRLILSFCAFALFGVGVLRLTANPALVILSFNIASFAIEAIQFRNMLMLACAVFGFSLMQSKRRFSTFVGFAFLFFGTTLHSLGYFFLLAGIAYLIPRKIFFVLMRIITYLSIPIAVLFLFAGSGVLQTIFARFLSLTGARNSLSVDLVAVYNNGISLRGWLTDLVITLLMLLPLIINSSPLRKYLDDEKLHVMLVPTFLSLVTIVLTLLSSDYIRVLRNAFLFSALLYSQIVAKTKGHRLIFLSYILVLSFLVFFLQNHVVYPESGKNILYTIGWLTDNQF